MGLRDLKERTKLFALGCFIPHCEFRIMEGRERWKKFLPMSIRT